jgi:hypothetical protein
MSPRSPSRSRRLLALALVCALGGIATFVVLAARAITIESASRAEAERRIAAIRAGLPSRAPLVEIDDQGRPVPSGRRCRAAARRTRSHG